MDSSTPQSPNRGDGIEQPPPYLHDTNPSASGEADDELPEYHDIEAPPPQLPSQRRASRTGEQHLASRVERELQSSRAYRRASAIEQNGTSFSPRPDGQQRRPSQIDVSDPNFCQPQKDDDPQTAMLREFAKSKLYVNNDIWGRQQAVVSEEDDGEPPKLLKWMKGKFSGHPKGGEEAEETEPQDQS